MANGSIEELTIALQENTEALRENTAAVSGGATEKAKPAAKPKAAATKSKAAAKPKFTADQVRDKVVEVKNEIDEGTAKDLIATTGYDKLADVVADSSKWDDIMALADEKLAEAASENDGDDGL